MGLGWISRNPNITMEMIKNYPDKPWQWKYMSLNRFTLQNIVKLLSFFFKMLFHFFSI
jgi:hypothetical protein